MFYVSFRSFEKYQNPPQNSKGLAFDFLEKRMFVAKNLPKSVFIVCEVHIPIHLDVKVLYVFFMSFEKILKLSLKSEGASLRFYRKTTVHGEKHVKNMYFLTVRLIYQFS
jgi:hypothetical protein